MARLLKPKSEKEILKKLKTLNQEELLKKFSYEIMSKSQPDEYLLYYIIKAGLDLDSVIDFKGRDIPLIVYTVAYDSEDGLDLLIRYGAKINQDIIDELWDMELFQIDRNKVWANNKIIGVLVSHNYRPSAGFLFNTPEKLSGYIDDATQKWGNINILEVSSLPKEVANKQRE